MIVFLSILFVILFAFFIFSLGAKDNSSGDNSSGDNSDKWLGPLEFGAILLFLGSWLIIFLHFEFGDYSAEYFQAIDPSNKSYTPFAGKYSIVLKIYVLIGVFSMTWLWIKNYELPPLLLLVLIVFTAFASVLFIIMAIQVCYRYDEAYGSRVNYLLLLAFVVNAGTSASVVIGFIRRELKLAKKRVFNNSSIDRVNQAIVRAEVNWGKYFILAFPFLLVPMILLMLFGYEYDSLVKVFTETATWNFSKETHPPFLDKKGHYLCTVAACGNPKIFKPVRLGMRHGNEIIVNRQLMIANAFEEKIENISPKCHYWIRRVYDRYGYNLSKKITTSFWSNFTYVLMKPLEWLFWIFLNLTDVEPQKRINRQYGL